MRFYKKTDITGPIVLTCIMNPSEDIPKGFEEISYTEYESIQNTLTNLSTMVALCCREIDYQAGETRLKYITAVPGQAETYLMKSQEAEAAKALGYPTNLDMSKYPLLAAEINATGASLVVVCETIIQTEALWRQKAGQIEGTRRKGKILVTACADVLSAIATKNTYVDLLAGM